MFRFLFHTVPGRQYNILALLLLLFMAGCRSRSAADFSIRSCEEVMQMEKNMLVQWIASFPAAHQDTLRRLFLDSLQFSSAEWVSYQQPDSLQLASRFDSVIRVFTNEKNGWKSALQITRWVYENACHGDFETLFSDSHEEFLQRDASSQYMQFALHRMAGGCAAYAVFTANMLTRCGIPARVVTFAAAYGSDTIGLHKAVVARPENQWILLDPMFPQYYADAKGNPLAFADIQRLAATQKTDSILTVQIPNSGGHYLGPLERMACYPVNSPTLGYTDVKAFYAINDKLMLVDCTIDNAFANPFTFSPAKDSLLKQHGLAKSYISFFYFSPPVP